MIRRKRLSQVELARRIWMIATFIGILMWSVNSFSTRKNTTPKKRINRAAQNKRKGYTLRTNSNGVRTRRKRPPRWETEGDSLFFVAKSDEPIDVTGETHAELLQNLVAHQQNMKRISPSNKQQKQDKENTSIKQSLPPHLSWGPLSTGPILSPKLQSLYANPTPIQIESFAPILSKKNAVIAAPTGSGKTLAYLLPLLCRVSRKNFGSIMLITPTTELALQIQAVVDTLWSPSTEYDSSAVYVIEPESDDSNIELQSITTEIMMENQSAPFIAGTASSISKWLLNCIKNGNEKKVLKRLETVILDEADRLLQTESRARIENEKKKGIYQQNKKRRQQKNSDTIALLEMITSHGRTFFVRNRHRVQLICASATVGRTLRRQIMEITDASSVEMGSVLVCADDRVGKDADKRKRSLLPETIQHTFVVTEKAESLQGPDMVKIVWDSLNDLPPGPLLIFPGQTGVQDTADTLRNDCGLKAIKTLSENIQETPNSKDQQPVYDQWETTPVFIIGEKFGRGLDIPNVSYVVLAGGAPNSPAAYAHLAGRTGRGGKPGKAITFVWGMKDAKRVVNIGHKLGLLFNSLVDENMNGNRNSLPRKSLPDKESLEKLTIPDLKELLKERGQKVGGRKFELVERLLALKR